jgi:quercetin dioxygenase-like cupin family protein
MIIDKMERMVRGWFIGDFEPSILRTKDFEVAYLRHAKGERWDPHYHAASVEYNYLIRGSMIIQGTTLRAGDIFVLEKGDVADPDFLEDCELICVKVPSLPSDKYKV